MVGGYKVIDLKGRELTLQKTYIPGIYEKLESALGKPIMLKNFIYTKIERNAFFGIPFLSDGSYYVTYWITGGILVRIRFSDDDSVTINETPLTQTSVQNLESEV